LTSQPPPKKKKKKAAKDNEAAAGETEDGEGVVQEDDDVETAGGNDSTAPGVEESAETMGDEDLEVAAVATGSADDMQVDEPETEAGKASLDYHCSVYLLTSARRFTLPHQSQRRRNKSNNLLSISTGIPKALTPRRILSQRWRPGSQTSPRRKKKRRRL
jgi:hypothetical protein